MCLCAPLKPRLKILGLTKLPARGQIGELRVSWLAQPVLVSGIVCVRVYVRVHPLYFWAPVYTFSIKVGVPPGVTQRRKVAQDFFSPTTSFADLP